MKKRRLHQEWVGQESRSGQQQQDVRRTGKTVKEETLSSLKQGSLQEEVNMTPGRAPAEGPDEDFMTVPPSHERWEQHTAERAPTEGEAQTTPVGRQRK